MSIPSPDPAKYPLCVYFLFGKPPAKLVTNPSNTCETPQPSPTPGQRNRCGIGFLSAVRISQGRSIDLPRSAFGWLNDLPSAIHV
jgi:hypothetical protein